tara:strand:- start:132 stop:476 length:345 start_codon:yes stop_codon:yes gene_type:complete
MAYKRSTDDIAHIKTDAAIDIAGGVAITCNGEMGTLSFTLDGEWAHDGSLGTIVWTNSYVEADSMVTVAMQNNVVCRIYIQTHAANTVLLIPVNYSGGAIDDDTVVKINYRISN